MSIFKKLFGKDGVEENAPQKGKANIEFAQLNYPPKILLAWMKAIEGHQELDLYLLNNGYEELYHTTQALKLNLPARKWLMENGYPHLMAMVNAAEGNEHAQRWLQLHGFELLFHLAMAIEGEMTSFGWLKAHTDPLMFQLAKTIKTVKDQIEFNHNDMYSFGKDL